MQAINEAYAALSNPASRDEYDARSATAYIPVSHRSTYSEHVSWSGHARSVRRAPGILSTAASVVTRLFRYVTG